MAVDVPELDELPNRGLLRTKWFPLVISDRTLFIVIILLAASHLASCNARDVLRLDLQQLRYEAIRSINRKIHSEIGQQTHYLPDDALIGAVAKLASYEGMYGSSDAYRVHMQGLTQMIMLRGGLTSLGLGGLLRRIVIWIDRNAAFLHGSRELYFPHDKLPDPNPAHFLSAS